MSNDSGTLFSMLCRLDIFQTKIELLTERIEALTDQLNKPRPSIREEILRLAKQRLGGVSLTELSNQLRGSHPEDRKLIINTMVENKEITKRVDSSQGKKGKTYLVYKSF